MDSVPDNALDDHHFLLFGAITQCFAHYEALFLEATASLSGASRTALKLITTGLGFAGLRESMLTLMRHGGVPVPALDRLLRLIEVPNTYVALHGDIVHSTWVKTEATNTIRPSWLSHGGTKAVKPLYDMGDSAGRLSRWPEEYAAYTHEGLGEILAILRKNITEIHAALADLDLVADA